MAKTYDGIDESLSEWMSNQPVFFVSTAPLDPQGSVNCSPKGNRDEFAVLGARTVAFLDQTGSGVETIAHLRENGRIVVMFCALEGPPQIVRLHGAGRVVLPADSEWGSLAVNFADKRAARAIIVVDVSRVSDSCGFAIPRFDFVDDRDLLDRWADNHDDQAIADYQVTRNAQSIDGLPALRS
jgi:Pyridoxamine 5'-phosphate oxidase